MGTTMATDLQELERALQTYLDGLYEGDTGKLAAAFHDESHLFSVTDGKLDYLPRARWFELVRNRPSARSRDLPRRDWVGADRPVRPEHGARQGTMSNAAALFHGLPDIRETGGRLADHFENLPYRHTVIVREGEIISTPREAAVMIVPSQKF